MASTAGREHATKLRKKGLFVTRVGGGGKFLGRHRDFGVSVAHRLWEPFNTGNEFANPAAYIIQSAPQALPVVGRTSLTVSYDWGSRALQAQFFMGLFSPVVRTAEDSEFRCWRAPELSGDRRRARCKGTEVTAGVS